MRGFPASAKMPVCKLNPIYLIRSYLELLNTTHIQYNNSLYYHLGKLIRIFTIYCTMLHSKIDQCQVVVEYLMETALQLNAGSAFTLHPIMPCSRTSITSSGTAFHTGPMTNATII